MIRRCTSVGGEAGIRMMQEFVDLRRADSVRRIAAGHAQQNADRARHAAQAAQECRRFVEAYNSNFRQPEWGVVTTLVSMYLALSDAAARYWPKGKDLSSGEAFAAYWPNKAPRTEAAELCYMQAYKAAVAIGWGLYLDMLDRYPSRVGYPKAIATNDGLIRADKRPVAIGIDDDCKLVELSLREKYEIQAASYIEKGSLGAWLGFMALDPPDDWDAPRTLPMPHWGPEWGHPSCILPEKSVGAEGLFRNSVYYRLDFWPQAMARGLRAIETLWQRRHQRQLNLTEPSFTSDEAIRVFGAVVGICPQSEAAARQFFRFCRSRRLAGRLSPRWTLRLCRAMSCSKPLFIHKVPQAKGNAALPNYCLDHIDFEDAERQRRRRSKARPVR